MTLRYRRGMTFGEFQDMLDEHYREQEDRKVALREGVLGDDCVHPFDAAGCEWTVQRQSGSVVLSVAYRCTTCGRPAGMSTKRLRNKAKT